MKEQKKSRKDQSEQYEEDDTLDIIEALDQMEQTGKMSTNETPEDENMIELTLDDEDLVFDDEQLDNEGEFHFDESMAAGLGEEFSDNAGEVETGEGDVHADFGDESFSLDLNEDDNESDLDLSFDEDVHFELDETPIVNETEASEELAFNVDDQAEDLEFDLDIPSSEPPEIDSQPDVEEIDVMQPDEEEVVTPEHEEPMLNLDEEDSVLGFSEPGADQETDLSSGIDLGDFDLDLDAEETFPETPSEPEAEATEAAPDEEEGEDVLAQPAESPEEEREDEAEEDAFGDELGLGETFDLDTDEADSHQTEMESEQVADEFPGTSRISVDGEEVVDLGDETEFDQFDQYEDHDELEMSDEAEGFTGIEEDMGALVDHAVAGMSEAAEEDEDDFDVSIEDFDIDLEEEAAKEMFESPEGAEAEEETGFEETPDSEPESELDVNANLAQFGGEVEPSEPTEPAEMLADHPQMEAPDETAEPPEVEQEEQPDMIAETSGEAVEETGFPAEPERDVREELGLDLRLGDTQIDDFEKRVTEAQTLQNYITELDEHKSEINERIYEKLKEEYRSRKIGIFKESEFVSMQSDVEHDLQDMVAKRDEFANTVGSLKAALEEVKVRHLVGEYTDTMLREKEEAQKAEITQWQEKTEKIEHIITRYQELLEAERELNPLQQTAAPAEPAAAEPSPSEPVQESTAAEMPTSETPSVSGPTEPETEDVLVSDEDLFGEESAAMTDNEPDTADEGFGEWEMSDEDLEAPTDSWMDQEFGVEDSEADFSDLTASDEEFELDQFRSDEDTAEPQDVEEEEMITCKKCGRLTPAAEKFCVNCGAKAR